MSQYTKRVYLFISIILFFVLLFPPTIFAVDFYDDLSEGLTKWHVRGDGYSQRVYSNEYIDGVYGWYVANGMLYGEAGPYETSLLSPKFSDFSDQFEFSCKAINYNGVDQSFWFVDIGSSDSLYEINYRYKEQEWAQDRNKVSFRKTVDGEQIFFEQVSLGGSLPNLEQNVENELKIIFNQGRISIYLSSVLLYEYNDGDPIKIGSLEFRNWGGDFTYGRVKNSFDDIQIKHLPVTSAKPKVVVIPGLGASWNSLGVLGVSDPALKWKIPAFVNVYDNLINTFIGNGYQLNKDLFVWGYDWRPSIAQISTTFDSFIQETMVEDDEIILIGHSLGGLVARWWYQDHGNDSRIKKVISLGSPHWGAVDAYQAWNGGSVDGRGWSSVLFNLLILLNRDLTETNISVVQRVAPVVSDLQPTFDFAYRNNQLLPYTSMVNYNSSLDAKNSQFNGSPLVNLETIIGTGFATNQFINLGPRSFFDQRLGLWPDGRPMLLGKTNYGDGTVLSASSRLGQKYWELNSGHGELPTLAINHIMSVLGLGETSLTSNDNFSDKLIFYIASPAYLKINCGQADILSDEMGFVVVSRNDINGQCSLEVIPIGAGGDYKLLVSNTTNGDWLKIKGRVTDQNDNYSFDQNGNLNNQDNIFAIFKKYCQRLLDTYPSQADLVNCLNWAEKKQADEMVDSLFSFRSKTRQIDISWEMIDRIIPFLNNKSVNQQQALWYWKNGQDMLNLVEKMANLKQDRNVITDDFGVASYDLATRIFEQATNDLELGQLNDVYSRFSLAKRILEQVW